MKTIMVVDDEVETQEKVKDFLRDYNLNVVTASDSRKALELMDKKENEYGLLLVDTPFPGSSDRSAFISMKPDSNISSVIGKEEDFLEKPFTKQQLLDFVKSKMFD
ncbi:MAG: response regulator [Candidatus Thermoplasmatota archaeon]